MAVMGVFGSVDGVDVVMQHVQGDVWQVPVPLDLDGEYVVEVIAEDEAGNRSYLARMLYTVDAGNICIHMLPLPRFLFERQQEAYQFDRACPACKGVAL